MYSPVFRYLHMIASLVVLSVPASSIASAQMGRGTGMGGMGGSPSKNLEITILLGPDFDAQKNAPFTDAYELSTDLVLANQGVRIDPGKVSVDTTTELPTEPGIRVHAYYPKSFQPAELKKFQQEVKLNALRYGLTKVEFTAEESEMPRVFIRAGLPRGELEGIDFRKLIAAAADLGGVNPRLELYDGTRFAPDPFGSPAASADPFGGGGDPFGGPRVDRSDPFGDMRLGVGSTDPFGSAGKSSEDQDPFDSADSDEARGRTNDPFGGSDLPAADPIHTAEAKIKQLHTLQQRLTREIESTIAEHKSSKDADRAAELKSRLVNLVGSLFDSRQQLQASELSLMHLKLSATEALLRSREAQRASIVGRRVDALLHSEP